MYNNPYIPSIYNSQPSVDRINNQIAELEKMKQQLQQPVAAPTSLTQNFQIAPNNREVIRYAGSMDEVERDMVIGDTPYFSKDMSVVWIKNAKGDIKTYELNELVVKDDKDIKIDLLMSQIEELKKGMKKYEYEANVDESTGESVKNEKPSNVSTISKSSKKSK